jgi:hypothetical protein
MSAPLANTQVVGIKAQDPEEAAFLIAAVTGGRVIDTWRQDRQPLWDNVEPVADAEIKALARLLTERERMRRDRLIGCTA